MKQPNLLFVMADQMAAAPLPCYGGKVVKAPHLQALAERGVVFDAAYCNSPICAPSRFSMLSGRLPTSIGAYDNASELPASTPTLAHALSLAGYRTILAGKMHFIGPDQLHGYEERLTTDIYPADFAWTPNWAAGPRDKPSGISMNNVLQAGPCVRSLQIDYDDEVEHFALQRLYDLAREPESTRRPFFLTVSFSHPHPPYTAAQEHWNRYRDDEIDAPAVAPIPFEERDVHSQWLHLSHDADRQPVSAEQVRAARRAYYAMVSYVDDKIGRLMQTLAACSFADDTIVVVTADHGEMLGERGMFYKQCFFENSVRVPLIVHAPRRFAPQRVASPVSLVDLLPTFVDIAGRDIAWPEPMDGASLRPWLEGGDAPARPVLSEYTDMGVVSPCRMLRDGRFKYIHTHGHPAQLYDLEADPRELRNLAGDPVHAAAEAALRAAVLLGWNGDAVHRDVLASQRRRLFLKQAAAASGVAHDWSWQATRDDHHRFVRAGGAAGAKARARLPFRRMSILRVAREAGVSVATVSRAFNQPESVREETRRRVASAAGRVDYRPNASARTLRTRKSRVLGVVLPTLLNPVFAECLQGIAEAAAAAGYSIVPMTTEYRLDDELRASDALRNAGVDGLVLVVADPATSLALRRLKADGLRYVLAYNRHARHPCVSVDGVEALAAAVVRLASLGHRRIAMVSGERDASDRAEQRHQGFLQGMAAAGLKPLPLIEVPFMETAVEQIAAALRPTRRASALVCSNDLLAIRAVRAAHLCGLDVPRHLSVLGFDGIALGEDLTPALATITQPNHQIGRRSAQLLLDAIAGSRPLTAKSSLVLPHGFRVGESCAAPSR